MRRFYSMTQDNEEEIRRAETPQARKRRDGLGETRESSSALSHSPCAPPALPAPWLHPSSLQHASLLHAGTCFLSSSPSSISTTGSGSRSTISGFLSW